VVSFYKNGSDIFFFLFNKITKIITVFRLQWDS
jgi:hypothetical protein